MLNEKKGILYLISLPIGNREDITLRALSILAEIDILAAEDTRTTANLLSYYNIKSKLISYYDYNKEKRTPELIRYLLDGKNIGLVSDAGTPGLADPGYYLTSNAIKHNIIIYPIPGASALLSALVVSGLATDKFHFEGFLSSKKGKRKKRLEELKNETSTLIFYEAPHRLISTLEDIKEIFGERNISVSRELTKKFEETIRGITSEVLEHFQQEKPRGEFVLVIAGAKPKQIEESEYKLIALDLKEAVNYLIKEENLSKKEAIKKIAAMRGLPKKWVYSYLF